MRVTWLPDVLRAAGLDVYELPGWRGRGRPMTAAHGVINHATATSTRWQDGHVAALLRDGRRDLPGPLAQLGLERDGTFVVIADGRGNHNGYGTFGNNTIGIEVYNDNREERLTGRQVDALTVANAAILRHLGLGLDRCLGHKESDPRRKSDVRHLDMDKFRDSVALHMLAATGDDDLTPEQDKMLAEIYKWAGRVHHELVSELGTVRAMVKKLNADVADLKRKH